MLQGFAQIFLTLLVVIILAPIVGRYIAKVFMMQPTLLDPLMSPIESSIYRITAACPSQNMTGREYAIAVLVSNTVMAIPVFLILLLQGILPLNPTKLAAPTWDTVLHTTISFLVAADLQHYVPETTMSYLSQIVALGFLMFIAPATGLAVGIAFIRGLAGRPLGNFYVDLIRSITRVLLPFAVLGTILILALGVPETLAPTVIINTLEGATQGISRGSIAHFESIKILGENGGAYFAGNSAHPFENPNGATEFLQIIGMLILPTAIIYTYGIFINNLKQARLLFWMTFIIFAVLIAISAIAEYQGNPAVNALLAKQYPNLEGKEVRLGWAQTALFAITTTATMTGSANGMFDSLMPWSAFCALLNLFLQVIWGSLGTGAASLFMYLMLTVFLTGLIVGRTPELFGRKIEQYELTLASLIVLIHPIIIFIPAAATLALPLELTGISNPGFHGFTQVVYEYASAAATNGSGFAGLANTQPAPTALWWNLSTALTLWIGRYIPIVAMLLLTDSMSQKLPVPVSVSTLKTDTKLFTSVTGVTILVLGALTFFPILAFGSIAEAFQIAKGLF